jgi:hypothetical protein
MTTCRAQLRELQGRLVGIALETGERIDECRLISSAQGDGRAWVFANGQDIFVPLHAIRDCWEVCPRRRAG